MKHAPRRTRIATAQPPLQRSAWRLVAAAFWLFYAYLWLPGSTLVAWTLGFGMAYGELYERSENLDPFVVAALPPIAILSACVLIAWAEHNRLCFSGHERRLRTPDVPRDELARALGVPLDIAERMSREKVAILDMDDAAHPVAVLAPVTREPNAGTQAIAEAVEP